MEDIFSVKNIGWMSEEPINLKSFYEKYSGIVTSVLDGKKLNTRKDIRQFFPPTLLEDQQDPFAIERLEAACSPDLLTVKNELLPQDISQFPASQTGRACNWYAGTFQDKVIPEGGPEALHTLAALTKEHHLRETVEDYAVLRHKQLKYSKVLRLVTDERDVPEPTISDRDTQAKSQDDIVVNVRIHRPFHKRTYCRKQSNTFPRHSQELLVLGSQKLTDLRDNINCINDLSVCKDMSASPQLRDLAHLRNAASEFPSGFFYINGVFYSDMRNPKAKDYSEAIKLWAQKKTEIGPMTTKKMEDTRVRDLEFRLGYPYVFVHLGNCEHIVVFVDARLKHKQDVQDPNRYPINWGQPIKLATKCSLCSLNLANWIVKGDPRLPQENCLLCDRCLKTFCYDKYGKKVHSLKVYPYMDEFLQKQKNFTA
ncbi:snRNA-activating protein complex subunit 3-like [Portunus trituberculatus]|nr:snRNA-activating protein complex subunit 3-like [Portunus trituberculatus]